MAATEKSLGGVIIDGRVRWCAAVRPPNCNECRCLGLDDLDLRLNIMFAMVYDHWVCYLRE